MLTIIFAGFLLLYSSDLIDQQRAMAQTPSSGVPADEVALVTDDEDVLLELELLCAAAFILDRQCL